MAADHLQALACQSITDTLPDEAILAAWDRRKAAWQRCEALPLSDIAHATTQEAECMAIVDAAERVICNATATTPRGLAIQLWTSIDHNADALALGMADAIKREDIAGVCSKADGLDWEMQLMVAALRSALAQDGE